MIQVESIMNQLKKTANTENSGALNSAENQALIDFSTMVNETLTQLQWHIDKLEIEAFYKKIEPLKYLIEYSDELNKNWYLIRAYSGAISRLLISETLENAVAVYLYYENTYGGRRILRDENWFEQNRWDFLDELKAADSEEKLHKFIQKRTKKLNQYFQVYKSELLLFTEELIKLSGNR